MTLERVQNKAQVFILSQFLEKIAKNFSRPVKEQSDYLGLCPESRSLVTVYALNPALKFR